MSLCARVWAQDEAEPSDGMSNLTTAPKNWFRETPAYAAELYSLERWLPDTRASFEPIERVVYVRDDAGRLHKFDVRLRRETTVDVKVAP